MSAQPDDAPPMPPTANEEKIRWFALVFLVALASHAYVYFFFHYTPSNDEREYVALGQALCQDGELRLPTGDGAKRMPLYPAFIAGIQRWQGAQVLEHAVIEVQTILSLVTTLLIALIALRLSDARGAVVAGLVAALYAPYRYLQAVLLSETLVIVLLTGAIFLYLVSLQSSRSAVTWSSLGGSSLLLGLAMLTRADAAVFAIPFAVHAAGQAGPARWRIARSGLLWTGVALAALGWGYRNHRAVGTWTLSTTAGLNFYLGNNPDYSKHPGMNKADYDAFDRLRRDEGLSELEADRRLFAQGRAFVADHPAETLANTFRKLRVWLVSTVTWSAPGTPLIVLWTLAIAARASSHRRTLTIWAVLTSILWMIVFWRTQRPWTNPAIVVPLGLIGLFTFKDQLKIRWLLVGLFASQLAVAVVFIPLERLRWTVDAILIIALGAAVARLCHFLAAQSEQSEPRT